MGVRNFTAALLCLFAAGIAFAATPGTEVWTSGAYVYDGTGAISKIGSNTYKYDTAKRMKQYLPEAGGSQSFTYDAFGNIKRIDYTPPSGGTPISRIIPIEAGTNQIGSSAGVVYDRSGNMLSYSGATFKYDSQNMMVLLEATGRKIAYAYDADDQRIGTFNVLTKTWTWTLRNEDGKVLREYTSSGGTYGAGAWLWSRDYVYRGGTVLASAGTEGTRHYHVDHLRSPRLVTDASGVKKAFHTYMPFGEEETSILQDRERLRFTGHERDFLGGTVSENKDYIDYMLARYYNPTLGRFLSVDPKMQTRSAALRPQLWNRYSYVANNPLIFIDPTGMTLALHSTADCTDNPSNCFTRLQAYDAVKSYVGSAAARFLRLNKDGTVTLSGIAPLDFGRLGFAASQVGALIRSSQTAHFTLSNDKETLAQGGGRSDPVTGGMAVHVAPSAYPQERGGVLQTVATGMSHEFGHAVQAMYNIPLDSPAYGRIVSPYNTPLYGVKMSEGYAVWAENQYRAQEGLDPRTYYWYGPDADYGVDYAPPSP